jgi:hypothetical protein
MDSFEEVVSELLWNKGYWVWTSFKVKLTKEDKEAIDNRTIPRWEIDIVAYDAQNNIVHIVECKSYFDNPGVGTRWIGNDVPQSRAGLLKIFKSDNFRKVVFERLKHQLVEEGRCQPNPKIRLALACGHIRKGHRDKLIAHFKSLDWDLYDEEWLRKGLREVAAGGYDNMVSAVVAKLAYREEGGARRKTPSVRSTRDRASR